MRHRFLLATMVALMLASGSSRVSAQGKNRSYPITFAADDVHTIDNFSIERNSLQLKAPSVLMIPIRCEVGITGAVILGDGTYRYQQNDDSKALEGKFTTAMLRFHPTDQPQLLPIPAQGGTTDSEAHERGRKYLDDVFSHCWHSGAKALLPDVGSLAANVDSATEGDLLMSMAPGQSIAYSFSQRKMLTEAGGENEAEPTSVATAPPVVVKTVPAPGETAVDPSITEIRVTFSKKMLDRSWSWVQLSSDTFPETTGKPSYQADGKTCVLPVKLEPGRAYVVWLNSEGYGNFKDSERRTAVPYLLVFETKQTK